MGRTLRSDGGGAGTIYQQGNILIEGGRLRMRGESLPLTNIVGASLVSTARPKRHWTAIMIVAVLLLLAGIRFSDNRWGWGMFVAGALVGTWAWLFHRQRVWIVRLHLLLNQRIQILFERVEDADEFLSTLSRAKGGELKVARV